MKVEYFTDIQSNLHFLVFETFNKVYQWSLSRSDLKVLAEFYNVDFQLLKTVPKYKERMTILFSKDSKESIYKRLGMSYNTFNNVLSKLRKKGIISNNELVEKYLFNLNVDNFTIVFNIRNEAASTEIDNKTQQTLHEEE